MAYIGAHVTRGCVNKHAANIVLEKSITCYLALQLFRIIMLFMSLCLSNVEDNEFSYISHENSAYSGVLSAGDWAKRVSCLFSLNAILKTQLLVKGSIIYIGVCPFL